MTDNTIQLDMQTEQPLIERDLPSQRTLEITIRPPEPEQGRPRPGLNLALVLDRSGSMAGTKLPFAKTAALQLLDLLDEHDQAAVVAFDDTINLVAGSTPVSAEARRRLGESIQQLRTGGSTNLSEGWLTGCREVAAHPVGEQLARALLLTDGQANAGIIEIEALAVHARELYSRGISTSTFGIGEGFNEHLLEAMATAGGGSFYFIDSPQRLPEIYAREFGELAAVALRQVELTLDAPGGVALQVLGGWWVEAVNGRQRVQLGALQGGRTAVVYVNVLFPPASQVEAVVLKAQAMGLGEGGRVISAEAGLTFQYASNEALQAAPSRRDLLERSAQVRLADAVDQALKLERAGQGEKASRLLTQALQACYGLLPPEDLEKYSRMAQRMQQGMAEGERKFNKYQAYLRQRGREDDGSAKP